MNAKVICRVVLLFAGILFPFAASSQMTLPVTIIFAPASPTAGDSIVVQTLGISGCDVSSTLVSFPSPGIVRIDFVGPGSICPATRPPPILNIAIGALPPGAYTVNIFFNGAPAGSANLAVAAVTAIPTLSESLLLVLVALIAAIGLVGARRVH